MNELIDLISQARKTGNCEPLTRIIPYTRWMGISTVYDGNELLGRLAYSEMLIGNPAIPALHGGTLGALLESTAIFQVLWEAETLVIPKTINISIDYLRSAKAQDVYAKGIITKLGRRVANVRAEAWQEDPDRLIAIAHAHFLIVPVGDEANSPP